MFSIIIPTRNSTSYIHRALDSIILQDTELNIDVYVIDDASEDVDLLSNIVFEYQNKLNIKLIKNDKKTNAAVCRNIGINAARDDSYICLLDADDYWSANKLSSGYSVLQNKNKYVLYGRLCRGTYFDIEHNGSHLLPKREKKKNETLGEYWFISDGYTQTSSLMFKKSDFSNIKFNENLVRHQDLDFCLKLEKNGANFYFDDESITYWVILDSSVTSVSKGASVEFCLQWLDEYKCYLSDKALIGYLVHVLFLISLKQNKVSKWLMYMISNNMISFYSFMLITKLSLRLLNKHVFSKSYILLWGFLKKTGIIKNEA